MFLSNEMGSRSLAAVYNRTNKHWQKRKMRNGNQEAQGGVSCKGRKNGRYSAIREMYLQSKRKFARAIGATTSVGDSVPYTLQWKVGSAALEPGKCLANND